MAVDVVTCMRVFTAVVDRGSFAAAADRLDYSRGMVTRYVGQLEAHLGVRLLQRSTRKLSLTEAGAEYYQRSVQVLGMVDEAASIVAHEAASPRGILRVTSSVAFGVHHLGKLICEYLADCSQVQVDVTLNDRAVDLIEEGFDLAIRVAREIDPGLIARRVTRARIVPCAAPAYLAQHGMPEHPSELAQHNCLNYAYWSQANEWRFQKGQELCRVPVKGNLRGNNGDILLEAAVEGLGVVLHPTFLIHKALESGQLVQILPDWRADELSVFAVYPNRKFLPPKVRSFIDFLAEHIGPEPYWDQGLAQQPA